MLGTLRLLPLNVCDSRGISYYAMAYSIGTSSGGYLTLASYRAIVSSCETRDARWLCECQCMVVVTNESELSVCPLCEGSTTVQYFALS